MTESSFLFVDTIFPLTFASLILRQMIAIVRVSGQQFKVEKDQTIYVPRVEGKAGDKLDLEVLLAEADGKVTIGSSIKTKVQAEIVDHVKGDTVIAYKQKRRKGFHNSAVEYSTHWKVRPVAIDKDPQCTIIELHQKAVAIACGNAEV